MATTNLNEGGEIVSEPFFIQPLPIMSEDLSPARIMMSSDFGATPPPKRSNIVKLEEQSTLNINLSAVTGMDVEDPVHFHTDRKKKKQPVDLDKYRTKRTIVQAKVQDYTLESLGNMLQFLKIHDNEIEVPTMSRRQWNQVSCSILTAVPH